MPINITLDGIIEAYNLQPLIHNGAFYVEIHHGMYGFLQAGLLANQQLSQFLTNGGYHQILVDPTGSYWILLDPTLSYCILLVSSGSYLMLLDPT